MGALVSSLHSGSEDACFFEEGNRRLGVFLHNLRKYDGIRDGPLVSVMQDRLMAACNQMVNDKMIKTLPMLSFHGGQYGEWCSTD